MHAAQTSRFPIVVLISGSGTNLQAIIDHCQKPESNIAIKAVISNKTDAYGLTRAKSAGIPTHTLESQTNTRRAQYDRSLAQLIDQYSPKLVVLAGFMRILGPEFVSHYHTKLINIHPSLLPNYRGLNTHQRVIDAHETEHGASVHYVNNELDGGPLVLQAKVPVYHDDTAEQLAKRVLAKEHIIYPLVIQWIADKRIQLKQDTVYFDEQAQQQSLQLDSIPLD